MSDLQPTWIGRTIGGRYKIESLLGSGGMSSVYRATDPNLQRTVAIKIIHHHLRVDDSRRIFLTRKLPNDLPIGAKGDQLAGI